MAQRRQEKGVLQIELLRGGLLSEFASALEVLNKVYQHLYTLDLIVQEAKERAEPQVYNRRRRSGPRLRSISKVEAVVLPEDRLRITHLSLSSPGLIDLVGSLNPLETLRQYLKDRHERRKDAKYREAADAEKLDLGNQKLRQEVILGDIEILRQLGYGEDVIRLAISKHFFEPADGIDRLQDANLIGGAQLKRLPPPAEDGR